MNTRQRGLFKKYNVSRTDKKPIKGGCIVLEFGSRNTADAILQFADSVESDGYGPLAADLRARLGFQKPTAQQDFHDRRMTPVRLANQLRKQLDEAEARHAAEYKRLKVLLVEAQHMLGRATQQLFRAGLAPTSTEGWDRPADGAAMEKRSN